MIQEGLPVEDWERVPLTLVEFSREGQVIGWGGFEDYQAIALVRSILISSKFRGQGLGKPLVEALEKEIVERGAKELYLLTTDAQGFFDKVGYSAIDRKDAPIEIQETPEFKEICSSTAIVIRKLA